jgi:acetyl esterase/lipase
METLWRRRAFLGVAATGVIGGTGASARQTAGVSGVSREAVTYKTAGNQSIKADVWVVPPKTNRRAVAIWIHGGALIMGDRSGIDRSLLDDLLKAGYAVVSIDYRLAPETKLTGILEDVRDAISWVRKECPRRLGAEPERIAVLGGSAGGYLTLASGFIVEPHPLALVSFWGYGDIAGNWYSRPDEFYRRQPLISESDARAAVGTAPLTEPPRGHQRYRFYLYCRQNGLWPKAVTGHDPEREPKAFDAFCPIRHVTPKYPPTLLIHGTNDTDVPHEQSVLMHRELSRHRVPHEFISVKAGTHGLGGLDRARLAEIRARVIAFLGRYIT